MNFIEKIQPQFNQTVTEISNAITLLQQDSTIPFIVRYRKDETGNMDEPTLYLLQKLLKNHEVLESRRKTILESLETQKVSDENLIYKIKQADSLSILEDYYAPYKPRKQTKADLAIEMGLKPIAISIMKNDGQYESKIKQWIKQKQSDLTEKEVLTKSLDIVTMWISENVSLKRRLTNTALKQGKITSKASKTPNQTFSHYHDFSQLISRLSSHQILAMNRGESQKALIIHLELPDTNVQYHLEKSYPLIKESSLLSKAGSQAYKNYLLPSIETEIRQELTLRAHEQAVQIFANNVKQALLKSPIKNHQILAIDPGFKHGCKWAVINEIGNVLTYGLFYLHNFNSVEQNKLLKLIKETPISLVAIGNGTGSVETFKLFNHFLKENDLQIPTISVDESGASVYSTTDLAQLELPDLPINTRSAVSLGRRLLDPMAELVKINPKSIGVGQYQHDLNQTLLSNTLKDVVIECVNKVGISLNHASFSLLSYVSGLTENLAKNILNYKKEHGLFKNRQQLLNVKGIGPKIFHQCSGFLMIENSDQPFDQTFIHPESYKIAQKFMDTFHISLFTPTHIDQKELESFASENKIGMLSLLDIYHALTHPFKDIRDSNIQSFDIPTVTDFKDLNVGQTFKGVIKNITTFGIFIDLRIHLDGFIPRVFLPKEDFVIGQEVDVIISNINHEKKQIQLKLID